MTTIRTLTLVAVLALLATPTRAGDEKQAKRDPRAAGKALVADTGMMGTNEGGQIYAQICQGCHMPGGKGAVGAGRYPAFANNPAIASAPYMVVTILQGRRNMPSFTKPRDNGNFFPPVYLTDVQVAAVVNYVRSNFGNAYPDRITAEDVAKLKPQP
jgi:mono/diheme cytochrome c family protein